MELEEALLLIKQACAAVQADLPTHQKLQAAVQTIENKLNAPAKKEEA